MSGDPERAPAIGARIIELAREHLPDEHPMEVAAGMAMALGAMVGTRAVSGISKPGRSGAILDHLFNMVEAVAADGLESVS